MCIKPLKVYGICKHDDPLKTPPDPKPDFCSNATKIDDERFLVCSTVTFEARYMEATPDYCKTCSGLVDRHREMEVEYGRLLGEMDVPSVIAYKMGRNLTHMSVRFAIESSKLFPKHGSNHGADKTFQHRIELILSLVRYLEKRRTEAPKPKRLFGGDLSPLYPHLATMLEAVLAVILLDLYKAVKPSTFAQGLETAFVEFEQQKGLSGDENEDDYKEKKTAMQELLYTAVKKYRDIQKAKDKAQREAEAKARSEAMQGSS